MVAFSNNGSFNKITEINFCTTAASEAAKTVPVHPTTARSRAKDLLPWADPYIVKLIRRLQQEVREERTSEACNRPSSSREITHNGTPGQSFVWSDRMSRDEQVIRSAIRALPHSKKPSAADRVSQGYERWSHLRPRYDRSRYSSEGL